MPKKVFPLLLHHCHALLHRIFQADSFPLQDKEGNTKIKEQKCTDSNMECRFLQEIEYGILHAEPEEEDKERIQSPRENQIEEGIADKASLHGKVFQI